MRITFSVESAIALTCDRYPQVDWNAVVSNAIRTKAKMMQQTAAAPVQAVKRDPMPWLTIAERKRAERPPRAKSQPRPKPAAPTAEEIQRRRELLLTAR